MTKYYTVQELNEIRKPKTLRQDALERTLKPYQSKKSGASRMKSAVVKEPVAKMARGGVVAPRPAGGMRLAVVKAPVAKMRKGGTVRRGKNG